MRLLVLFVTTYFAAAIHGAVQSNTENCDDGKELSVRDLIRAFENTKLPQPTNDKRMNKPLNEPLSKTQSKDTENIEYGTALKNNPSESDETEKSSNEFTLETKKQLIESLKVQLAELYKKLENDIKHKKRNKGDNSERQTTKGTNSCNQPEDKPQRAGTSNDSVETGEFLSEEQIETIAKREVESTHKLMMQFIKALKSRHSIQLNEVQLLKSKIHFVTASSDNQSSCFSRSCSCLDFVKECPKQKSKKI